MIKKKVKRQKKKCKILKNSIIGAGIIYKVMAQKKSTSVKVLFTEEKRKVVH